MALLATQHAFWWKASTTTSTLADAITYVQLVNPDCELTDDEIGSLIGWHAATRLCNLKFDLRERSPSMHKGWRSFNDGTPTAH
ncbi:MAG: hypothetical protein ACT6RL_21970 [Neoaquamicrobium sediminum]|uniref:hypothetical protein n=1 Tax=Neoaquamicrobium sediminum TaxID=1849104 RepID=UPI0040378179